MRAVIYILFLMISIPCFGRGFLRSAYDGVRQTGMGNTGVALGDDSNMMWYNPAGLARVKKVTWNLIDITGGFDSLDTLSRGYNALFNGDEDNLIRFDTQQFKFNVHEKFFAPSFGLMFYNNLSAFFDFQNFQANDVDVAVFNDAGITAGFGLPLGKHAAVGVTAKGIIRGSSDLQTTVADLFAQYGTTLADFQSAAAQIIQDNLASGYGIGFDAGMLWTIPTADKETEIQLGVTGENLGGTYFHPFGSKTPSSMPMKFNFGAALMYESKRNNKFTVALDVRDPFTQGVPIFKMIHLGLEYKSKWFTARAGIMECYPTFGISIETPPHTKIHFTTYAKELGDNIWERETRMYMLQLIIGFNPL
jgi:hypothetical protein